MCTAIALAWGTLPTELAGRPDLTRRVHERSGELELQFHYRDRVPRLPIVRDGQLQVVRWGNGAGLSRVLPRTGWTRQESVEQGVWRNLEPREVEIPAILGQERGLWYKITTGIRGLLVPDERGKAVAFMICEPASHYYQVMTRSNRMPVFIGQRI